MTVSLTFRESHNDNSTRVGAYVSGPTNRGDVMADLLANLPATYGTLVFKSLASAELVEGQTDLWECEVIYGPFRAKKELQQGESEFQFSSSRSTFQRTISKESRVYVDGSETDRSGDYNDSQIIGVDWSGSRPKAEGISETEYGDAFQWKVAVPFSLATESYRRTLGGYRNTVCNQGFFGYAAYEVKMIDIFGGVQGEDTYVWTMQFERKPNPGNVNIGGIAVPNLRAWEVLDIDDQQFVEDEGILVPTVSRVKVHRNYDEAEWTELKSFLGV